MTKIRCALRVSVFSVLTAVVSVNGKGGGSNATGGLPVAGRVPLLILGMLSLLAGVAAGLARIGWAPPLPHDAIVALHGPLMVAAFFGTVIGLERAVALARRWGYLAPAASGAGGLAAIVQLPEFIVFALLALGSATLTAATLAAAARQPALHTRLLALAAALATAAALAWPAGHGAFAVAGWMAFLVLTIAAERLELSRFLPPSPAAQRVFVVIVGALLLALGGIAFAPMSGVGAEESGAGFGAALAALALWLLRQDIARRTARQPGLTGFIAVCLLSGYVWLLAGGLLFALQPELPLANDAALHAVFVGFVLAMVFGHAPIIFPAIVRVKLPYHPLFYLPLIVLHLSLAARIAGDLAGEAALRAAGGAGNAAAIAVFIATMLSAALRGRRK